MRTNIVLNEELLREAMQYTSSHTKKAVIEEALRTFIETKSGEKKLERYSRQLQVLQSKTQDIRFRQRPSVILRKDRDTG